MKIMGFNLVIWHTTHSHKGLITRMLQLILLIEVPKKYNFYRYDGVDFAKQLIKLTWETNTQNFIKGSQPAAALLKQWFNQARTHLHLLLLPAPRGDPGVSKFYGGEKT